jgi:hypothetical protein
MPAMNQSPGSCWRSRSWAAPSWGHRRSARLRSHACSGGRSDLRVRWRWRWDKVDFPGAGFWESKGSGFLLLLAENYSQTTNDLTTETQSAQRTHRDFLKGILGSLRLDDPYGRGQASPGSCSWPLPVWAAPLVGVDWLAWRVPGGRVGAKTTGSR